MTVNFMYSLLMTMFVFVSIFGYSDTVGTAMDVAISTGDVVVEIPDKVSNSGQKNWGVASRAYKLYNSVETIRTADNFAEWLGGTVDFVGTAADTVSDLAERLDDFLAHSKNEKATEAVMKVLEKGGIDGSVGKLREIGTRWGNFGKKAGHFSSILSVFSWSVDVVNGFNQIQDSFGEAGDAYAAGDRDAFVQAVADVISETTIGTMTNFVRLGTFVVGYYLTKGKGIEEAWGLGENLADITEERWREWFYDYEGWDNAAELAGKLYDAIKLANQAMEQFAESEKMRELVSTLQTLREAYDVAQMFNDPSEEVSSETPFDSPPMNDGGNETGTGGASGRGSSTDDGSNSSNGRYNGIKPIKLFHY